MRMLDAGELEGHVAEVLRQLQEEGEPIDITRSGEVVARLVPVQPIEPSSDVQAFISKLNRMAAEIGQHLPEKVDAVEAVREIRREL
jgi:antitoxin (DNA-binding transcriptional repressor) of toxin-antitoxin stability system